MERACLPLNPRTGVPEISGRVQILLTEELNREETMDAMNKEVDPRMDTNSHESD